MLIPDKLDPIPGLDRSLLPAWINDVGTVYVSTSEYPRPVLVMTAKAPNGDLFNISAAPSEDEKLDDTIWQRYMNPMVNCLGQQVFLAEYGDIYMDTVRWEVERPRQLTDRERDVIARRNELTGWRAPLRVLPD